MFLQFEQEHFYPQAIPYLKQLQYYFKHRDFEQLQVSLEFFYFLTTATSFWFIWGVYLRGFGGWGNPGWTPYPWVGIVNGIILWGCLISVGLTYGNCVDAGIGKNPYCCIFGTGNNE